MAYQSWIALLGSKGEPTKLEEGDVLWFDTKDGAIHVTRGDMDLRFLWGDTSSRSRVTNSFDAAKGGPCALEFTLRFVAGCAGFALEATTVLNKREGGFRLIKQP